MGALHRFERAYTQSVLDRMIEPLRRAFPSRDSFILSSEDVALVCKHTAVQVDIASHNALLVPPTIQCVTQAVQYFCQQVEAKKLTGEEAYKISEKITPAQNQNASLFNGVYRLYDTLFTLTRKASPRLQEALHAPMTQLHQVASSLLDALFHHMRSLSERIIVTLHNSEYGKANANTAEASRFVQMLRKQVHVFCQVTLAPWASCPMVDERSIQLAQRIFVYFVRHAALIRPLTEAGKMKMAGDMAHLESAVTPLVIPKVSRRIHLHKAVE